MENSDKSETFAHFLISEFTVLNERAKSYEEIKSSRVNFFLIVVAAAGAIFSALSQNAQLKEYNIGIIQSLSAFILLLGAFILKDMTAYSMAVVTQYRRAGRIRRWFLDHHKKFSKYVAYSATDDKPAYTDSFSELHWRGAETIVLLINCIAFLLLLGTILYHDFENELDKSVSLDHISVIISIICAALFWYVQKAYVYLRMNKFQKSDFAKHNIHFPSEKPQEK